MMTLVITGLLAFLLVLDNRPSPDYYFLGKVSVKSLSLYKGQRTRVAMSNGLVRFRHCGWWSEPDLFTNYELTIDGERV